MKSLFRKKKKISDNQISSQAITLMNNSHEESEEKEIEESKTYEKSDSDNINFHIVVDDTSQSFRRFFDVFFTFFRKDNSEVT